MSMYAVTKNVTKANCFLARFLKLKQFEADTAEPQELVLLFGNEKMIKTSFGFLS